MDFDNIYFKKHIFEADILKYIFLMLERRGYNYYKFKKIFNSFEFSKNPIENDNKEECDGVCVFFRDIKITVEIIKKIFSTINGYKKIIIFHNTSLTTETNKNILNCKIYNVEIFNTNIFTFDFFKVLFKNKDDKFNIKKIEPFKESSKLPIILESDPICKYMNIVSGDIVSGKFDGTDYISLRKCV